ncbi:MAG: phage tail protein [Cyclobacteriaceae bacterium]
MPTDKATIAEYYPLPVYNYQVVVEENEIISFSEVSGLTIDYDHVLYRHGFSWKSGDYLLRTQRKPISITLKRGVSKNRDYLYEWLKSSGKRDIRIDLCDEVGMPLVSWSVTRALPLKLDAPIFNAGNSEVAIESLELIAHDLTLTHHT